MKKYLKPALWTTLAFVVVCLIIKILFWPILVTIIGYFGIKHFYKKWKAPNES